MKIRIVCLLIALYPLVVSAQTNSTDSIVLNYVLEGIIVKADRIIPKGDHQVIILSDKNRSFGTNALESVSSMEYFKTSINGTSLTSFDQKNVYILINGVPATGFDLRAYKGEDIKNVEYYPVAPAQYSMLTSGPVVNIVMKKRHDELYSAYINTNNAVNTGFGTNQVNLTYADSLNQVKVNYLIDYRDIRKIDFTSYYKYGNGLESSLETEKSRNYGNYQYIQTSYQRFQTIAVRGSFFVAIDKG